MEITKDVEALFARLDDLIRRAARREVGVSAFLSPRELHYARAFLQKRGSAFVEFGGYRDAERKKIYVLPDYMDGVTQARELDAFGIELGVCALKVKGSGFCKLSHRTRFFARLARTDFVGGGKGRVCGGLLERSSPTPPKNFSHKR